MKVNESIVANEKPFKLAFKQNEKVSIWLTGNAGWMEYIVDVVCTWIFCFEQYCMEIEAIVETSDGIFCCRPRGEIHWERQGTRIASMMLSRIKDCAQSSIPGWTFAKLNENSSKRQVHLQDNWPHFANSSAVRKRRLTVRTDVYEVEYLWIQRR